MSPEGTPTRRSFLTGGAGLTATLLTPAFLAGCGESDIKVVDDRFETIMQDPTIKLAMEIQEGALANNFADFVVHTNKKFTWHDVFGSGNSPEVNTILRIRNSILSDEGYRTTFIKEAFKRGIIKKDFFGANTDLSKLNDLQIVSKMKETGFGISAVYMYGEGGSQHQDPATVRISFGLNRNKK